jgi:hypothetical protein
MVEGETKGNLDQLTVNGDTATVKTIKAGSKEPVPGPTGITFHPGEPCLGHGSPDNVEALCRLDQSPVAVPIFSASRGNTERRFGTNQCCSRSRYR